MPTYAYKGLDQQGKEVQSSITSESVTSAKQKLMSQGVMLYEIKEKSAKSSSEGFSLNMTIGPKVDVESLSLMTRQFATLIKARFQVAQALEALVDQVENPTLRLVLGEVKQKVNEGSSLSKALSDYPRIFDNVYINMVDAGENSGTLDVVLLRLSEFKEAQVKLKNKIRGAIMYPVVMMIVGSVMISIVFTVVIPKITKIFTSSKKTIPTATKIAIWISEFLQNNWYLIIIAAIVFYFLFKKWSKTKKGEYIWHKTLLNMPIIGHLTSMVNISRFCSTLATLRSSDVEILVALKIVKNLIPNVVMKEAIDDAKERVSEGQSMVGPLKESGYFPPMVTHMIALGEKSGEVVQMLEIIAENYEDQVNTRLEGLTSILEPIMMVGLGGVVGFVVFAVIIPMLELNKLN